MAPTRLRMAAPHVSSNIMFSESRRKCVSSLGFQKVHHWLVWNGLSSSKTDVKIKIRPFRGTRIPRSEPSASKAGLAPSAHPAGLRGCGAWAGKLGLCPVTRPPAEQQPHCQGDMKTCLCKPQYTQLFKREASTHLRHLFPYESSVFV